MSKTLEDIEKLRADWLRDPCWDIEETEGCEEYKAELLAFRKNKEEEWKAAYKRHMDKLRGKICPVMTASGTDADCLVDECAWWDSKREKCGILPVSRKETE